MKGGTSLTKTMPGHSDSTMSHHCHKHGSLSSAFSVASYQSELYHVPGIPRHIFTSLPDSFKSISFRSLSLVIQTKYSFHLIFKLLIIRTHTRDDNTDAASYSSLEWDSLILTQ